MAVGNYARLETLYRKGWENQLDRYLAMVGQELRAYVNTAPDEYEEVYGVDAGIESDDSFIFLGIVVTYELTPIDTLSTGTFAEGFLYTKDDRVLPGQVMELVRVDDTAIKKRWKIQHDEATGQTQTVFQRFKLTSISS